MKEKIKNLFSFIGRAWNGGFVGKVGVILAILLTIRSVNFFLGETTVQGCIMNIWRLNAAQQQLLQEQEKLDQLEKHIALVQQNSPDYIEELGLKRLNMGDAKTKILKL